MPSQENGGRPALVGAGCAPLARGAAIIGIVLAFSGIGPAGSGATIGGQPPMSNRPTLEAIKAGLAGRFADIRDLTIRMGLSEEVINGRPPRPLVNFRAGEPVEKILGDKKLGYPWMKIEYRLDGERRYVQYTHPPFRADGKSTDVQVQRLSWDGKAMMRLEPNPTGFLSGVKENHVIENMLFRQLDWPTSQFDLNEKDHTFLPQSLVAPDTRVLSETERVADCDCVVVEQPGIDRLWIDVSKGFALVKRETRFGTDQPLKQVTTNDHWVEVNKGVWLPVIV